MVVLRLRRRADRVHTLPHAGGRVVTGVPHDPSLVRRTLEVEEEVDRLHADVELELVGGGAGRVDLAIGGRIDGQQVVAELGRRHLTRDGPAPQIAPHVRHRHVYGGPAVHAVAQRGARQRRGVGGDDRGVDHVGARLVLGVDQLRDVREPDGRWREAREALGQEAGVDVGIVGREVVDVAVVVVQGQPLDLDDRPDLRLVERVQPRQEQRVGDQVTGGVPMRDVQVGAHLPGGAHPHLAVGVHPPVAPAAAVSAELARVVAVADVVAGSLEVLADDGCVVEVHGKDVRVALAHPVAAVEGAVQDVQPVSLLVRDHRRVGGVHAASALRVEVDRGAVEEGVAVAVDVDVRERLEVGRRVRRDDRHDPLAEPVDLQVGVRLGCDQRVPRRVHQERGGGVRLKGDRQAVLRSPVVEDLVVGTDVLDGDVERGVDAGEREVAVHVGLDRPHRAGHLDARQRLLGGRVRGAVGLHAGRCQGRHGPGHVQVVHEPLHAQQLAVEGIDPGAPDLGLDRPQVPGDLQLPGQARAVLLAALHHEQHQLGRRDPVGSRPQAIVEEAARGQLGGSLAHRRRVLDALQARGRAGLHAEQGSCLVQEHVDEATHQRQARDLLAEAQGPLVGAARSREGQVQRALLHQARAADAVQTLGQLQEGARQREALGLVRGREARIRPAPEQHLGPAAVGPGGDPPGGSVLGPPAGEARAEVGGGAGVLRGGAGQWLGVGAGAGGEARVGDWAQSVGLGREGGESGQDRGQEGLHRWGRGRRRGSHRLPILPAAPTPRAAGSLRPTGRGPCSPGQRPRRLPPAGAGPGVRPPGRWRRAARWGSRARR